MNSFVKKQVLSRLWPKFSPTFDLVNRNAQMMNTIRHHEKSSISRCSHRKELYSVVNDTLGGAAISYLEFGVWKGESLEMWTGINANPKSRFYGFDSFEGLPETWAHGFGKSTDRDRFNVNGQFPVLHDPRVRFIKGWFQHTLRGFLSEFELFHPIVVHIDSDLHSSALYVLSTLDRILKSGDVVLFDEYTSPSNEYLAWEEYKRAFFRKADCIGMSDQWRQVAFAFD